MQKIALRVSRSGVLRNFSKYWHICNTSPFPPMGINNKNWGANIFVRAILTHSHHFHPLRSRRAVLWASQAMADRRLPSSSPRRILDVRTYPTARPLASERSELMSAISWYCWHFSLNLSFRFFLYAIYHVLSHFWCYSSGKWVYPTTVTSRSNVLFINFHSKFSFGCIWNVPRFPCWPIWNNI